MARKKEQNDKIGKALVDLGLKECVMSFLQFIDENPCREGLKKTPQRVIDSFAELYKGYGMKVEDVLTTFTNQKYSGMILLKDIEMYSMCEHHMLPFVGKCSIAYIPDKRIIGISKLARIMEIFSRRLQVQERLTDQIADAIFRYLEPKGCAVYIEAEHFCMRMRGANKQNSVMVTSSLRGCFKQEGVKQEFLQLVTK